MANGAVIAFLACVLVSVALLGALVVTWWLLPKWRSLQNYMAIMRILYSTAFLIPCYSYLKECVDKYRCDDRTCWLVRCSEPPYWWVFAEAAKVVFLLSTCWSLSSLVVAYIRLVLRYTGVVNNERELATVITHALAAAIYAVYYLTTLYMYKHVNHTVKCGFSTSIFLTLTMFNWFLFFKVTKGSLLGFKTSMGVALFCDMLTILVLFFGDCSTDQGIPQSIVMMLRLILIVTTAVKIIPQCVLILLSRSTRAEWRKYWLRRKRHHQSNEL